ncbi:MAG: hypothetical protein R3B48_13850 [Kofleriaceae bacterium]
MVTRAALCCSALALAACDPGFENPTEVIDLRPLAISAEPPEQVLDVDLTMPPNANDLLRQLRPVEICALAGDPLVRSLTSTLTVCVEGRDARCDASRPRIVLASGVVTPDPETAIPRPQLCARLEPDANLLAVLLGAIDADPLSGFSGIDLLIEWTLAADGAPAVYAGKRVRFAARVPERRTANQNPTVLEFTASVSGAEARMQPLPLGRCVDQLEPLTITAGDRVTITPVEPEGLRETYVVPTFDGGVREFTETIEYQWYTSAGTFSTAVSGGRRDAFGNLPGLASAFRSHAAKDVLAAEDAAIWIVQRDERLGVAWFESCVRVLPAP